MTYYSKNFFVVTLLVGLIIGSTIVANAQSPVTSVANTILTTGAGSGWSNTSNLSLLDGSAATSTALVLGGTSKDMQLTDLGFNIPVTASIEGIEVNLRVKASGALGYVVRDKSIKLIKGGSVVGNNKASGSDWPGSFATRTLGGNTDDWSASLTPADVNSSSFGVSVSVDYFGLVLPTAHIDYVGVTIYYSNALPVTISSFTATYSGDHNHLAWQTVNELNNELFIVQKSTDGTSFYDLTTLPGHHTSNTVNNYSYDDYVLTADKEYYRLIQKDVDGSITLSSVVTVMANSSATASILNSNGASHLVITNCEGKNVEVVFCDLSGRILFNQTLIPVCNIHSINLNEAVPEYEAVIIKARYDGQLFSEHFIITQ